MDLPDCPPGAEGYEDSVTEKPKRPDVEEFGTKAEQEFLEYLNGHKIVIENGETRCMVERRKNCGKWIYLCFPCGASCNSDVILQTHILGKKHKLNMSSRQVWPNDIFTKHPYIQRCEAEKAQAAQNIILPVPKPNSKYDKFKNLSCEVQREIDRVQVPMIGIEYLIEFPPEQSHYKCSYMCTLCNKHGHPRTIVNHMICFRHQYNYLRRHYPSAMTLLLPYRQRAVYQEGVSVVVNRIAKRVEDTHGRMRPLQIETDEFERDKDNIMTWIFNDLHFSELSGGDFVEVVDTDLITTLQKNPESQQETVIDLDQAAGDSATDSEARNPSPPKISSLSKQKSSKPLFNNFTRSVSRQERRAGSIESLSDISDEGKDDQNDLLKDSPKKDKVEVVQKPSYDPYPAARRSPSPRHRFTNKRNAIYSKTVKTRPSNYDYKVKLALEQSDNAEESAKKTYAYHEKNPEKHPLYPDEWKKFWNRRYKEIQNEGKDPSKHDFKPEWIQFWTKRMKEIHEEELRITVAEIYRKLCLTPPDLNKRDDRSSDSRKRSPDLKRRSPDLGPLPKWRMLDLKRKSPVLSRRDVRRRTPERRRSMDRRRSPDYRRDYRRDRRSPQHHHSPTRRRSPPRYRSRSRSPHYRRAGGARASRSPLSRRSAGRAPRNRSPQRPAHDLAPSMQTVLISDDELKPDDGLSPWNSADDIGSPVRSHTGSVVTRSTRVRHEPAPVPLAPQELGSTDNVVATLRLLVALEDHLGSLGPRVIDLLGEALKMEKDEANSAERLVERDAVVTLLETAKEKLKGAAQAGLVPPAAAAAVRAAVVRVAATLHHADTRRRRNEQNVTEKIIVSKVNDKAAVPVAGVGDVDRAQIAEQMAAALVAQGKTDVSSEELAQLVDAVIGMAEAKKREAQARHEPRAPSAHAQHAPHAHAQHAPPSKHKSTVSALQMLQSAYDENKDKLGKDEGPDAMDGLSDSDLETLLKNFNELSAEEQHSLIAYLKKLEAREPQRVERLRQYVSAAVSTEPKVEDEEAVPASGNEKLVAIESDDDDYTMEEVFKSAKQKVTEDQIRQEMEIVKKSLEEAKPVSVELPKTSTIIDLTNSLSSASDLLALVHASIQSQAPAAPASIDTTADVVHSNVQPISFGDAPDSQQNFSHSQPHRPQMNASADYSFNLGQPRHQFNFNMGNKQPPHQQGFMRPQNMPFGGRNNSNDNYNQPRWNGPMNNMQDQRGPSVQHQMPFDHYNNQGAYNQGGISNFNNRQDIDVRPPVIQPFGNFNLQNNFRGRGQFGGPGRGRGRGGFY